MKYYKYIIDSFDILLSEESEPIRLSHSNITSIYLERDYDSSFFPILRVNVILDPKIYYKIIKEKLNVKFRIRLQNFIYDKDNIFEFKKDVINDVYCAFIDESTPFLNEELFNKNRETERSEKTPTTMNNEYSFFLYKEDDLNNSKKIINSVISKASLTDIIAYLLYSSNIKNVLMSPLKNNSLYNEVLLLPITTLKNLIYLEQQYGGFYNNPSLIFFDIDCLYVIDSSLESKAYRKKEFLQTILSICDPINSNSFTTGSIVNEEEQKYIININPDSLVINNNTILEDQLEGNNFIVISPSTGEIKTIKSETIQRGEGTYKVLVNKFNNPKSIDFLKKKKLEESTTVNISISNFDINALTPNKEFLFVFENPSINKEYTGKYRMSKNILFLEKKGEYFVISGSCDFKKVKN